MMTNPWNFLLKNSFTMWNFQWTWPSGGREMTKEYSMLVTCFITFLDWSSCRRKTTDDMYDFIQEHQHFSPSTISSFLSCFFFYSTLPFLAIVKRRVEQMSSSSICAFLFLSTLHSLSSFHLIHTIFIFLLYWVLSWAALLRERCLSLHIITK